MAKNPLKGKHCPLCKNHCSLADPGCKKGQVYGERLEKNLEVKPLMAEGVVQNKTVEEKLMSLFHGCFHALDNRKGQHPERGRIFSLLLAHGTMSQKVLLAHMDMGWASLSELLGKIEKKHYIARVKDKRDKRNALITLTEQGQLAAEAMEQERVCSAKALFSSLEEVEQEQLEGILIKLLAGWSPELGGRSSG